MSAPTDELGDPRPGGEKPIQPQQPQAPAQVAQPLQAPPPSQYQAPQTQPPGPKVKAEPPKEVPFSWHDPHPIFVIIFIGPEKKPFGIQKDFLCHRSPYFQEHFAKIASHDTVEHTVDLPDTSPEIFGLVQHFIYTGRISNDAKDKAYTSYETLVSLWKLGNKLGMGPLCDQTLDAMITCRRTTGRIPSTPLIVQVWKDTPHGSTIRTLLLTWAAEYLDSSGDQAGEFAKSLPQEVLSELVMVVVTLKTQPKPAPIPVPAVQATVTDLRKNVHYLDAPSDDEGVNGSRKHRRVSGPPGAMAPPPARGPRTALVKPQKRRTSTAYIDPASITTAQKLDFCADLLARMLSGPGFWTRLVGPFRDPVDPKAENVPDYFDKVKRPMDLSTIKGRMDRGEYADEQAFLRDMRQIFENCFTYWKKGTGMYQSGEKLQKTFEEKFGGMNKWIAKMGGEEGE